MCSWEKSILPLLLFLLLLGIAQTSEAAIETSKQEVPVAAVNVGAPRVELSETLFDFGEMNEGEDYVHAFMISNVGTGVLEIKKVLPG